MWKPPAPRIASISFSFKTPWEVYVGSFRTLKHVDAVGRRESSEQSTRCPRRPETQMKRNIREWYLITDFKEGTNSNQKLSISERNPLGW